MSVQRRPTTLACLDMAGTTVADDGVVEGAFLDALDCSGVGEGDDRRPAMLDYVRQTMGTSKITVFRALFPDGETAASANRSFEEAYAERLGNGAVAPIPGAEEAIARLRRAGVRVALLTGFSAKTRDRLLHTIGWADIADLALCPEEAGRGRPYPDMVLTALLRLGTDDVRDVAVVGDTAADLESGLRAGAGRRVGVLSGFDSEPRLRDAGATDVIPSVATLPELLGL